MEKRKIFTFEQEKEARALYDAEQKELSKSGYECRGYEYCGNFDEDYQVCVWKKVGKEFKHKFYKDYLNKEIVIYFS